MSTNTPPEARRAPIKQDVIEQLRNHTPLADILEEGYGSLYGDDYGGGDLSGVVRPKNTLDKTAGGTSGSMPPVLILVGIVGDAQTQRSAGTVDADYLVQILVLRSDEYRRKTSSLWIDYAHDAVATALTHLSAGNSIPQGQSGGVEERWSEERNRWMSDKTFTYTT